MGATLDELKSWTLRKADESGSSYVEDAQLIAAINQAYRFVHGKLVQKFEDEFDEEGTVGNGGLFDTVVGTQGYSLPTGMKKLTLAEWRPDGSSDDNEWKPINRTQKRQPGNNYYNPPREGYAQFPFEYFTAGSKIYFRPVPDDVIEIRLWCVYSVDALEDGTDVTVISDDYDPLISELATLDLLGTSGEEIFNERFKLFSIHNDGLDETASNRNQDPEIMLITSERDD